MGEHKHNPVALVADVRPKCATCVHFLPTGQGKGDCHKGPPMAVIAMRQNAVGKIEEVVKSAWPPTRVDKWCGDHPEFMRWWSEYRDQFMAQNQLGDVTAEGRA